MQTWIPDIYVDLVKIFMNFFEMYGNLVSPFTREISLNFTKFTKTW